MRTGASGIRRLFTSESVTEGHPDKVADQISDAVLDAALRRDPEARVACETLVSTDLVLLAGEITVRSGGSDIDFEAVARKTIRDIGYTDAGVGFAADDCEVQVRLDPQSEDIALGVNTGGAGDQGLMFGYACRETQELMPLPIDLAHSLTRRLAELRRSGEHEWLRPDGKSQVTVQYDQNGQASRAHTIVVSTQHAREVGQEEIRQVVLEQVVRVCVPDRLLDEETILHVNPTGQFIVGGPQGDCGLTGRKIIVDTYGGVGHHGGGAFSGKDPTKVDRSASYMARYIAKNLVAAGMADRLEVQLAYAIGVAEPVSVHVDSFGTARDGLSDRFLEELVRSEFPLQPQAIIEALDLRKPRYLKTAAYGHFGRAEFPWERTDRAATLRRAVA
ncbi:MAG: methionine adenosyltransferase [Acidobacteria bacterium]|nr:methionine adenosyltransferase [Acidobacteriota bacterium]MCY3964346.1 methionine adenosyltransferase [Acidobacteriota bacterium]